MFKKILIANRGEIAVRIMKTCRRLNIKTVAIYSDADRYSLHVENADEAYYVGPSRVNESYLNMDRIIEIALEENVDGIHPGYGLLSENATFVKKVEAAGLIFIGPESDVIEKMGNKIRAREMMEKAKVPIIPGMALTNMNEIEVIKSARKIGFPLMIKAAAGGGGIGMERIEDEDELLKALPTLIKKSETFFRSSEIFLEKCIENVRHIEAQIVGDKRGNIICVGDRDCSIQRRNQKIIEEAPAISLSIEGRKKLHDYAVRAGKAMNYKNVGTVEFLVDDEENIYFLEMNTRLQVEHTVTEETANIDLVEWQLLIASGGLLPSFNETFPVQHAIEVRLYAEDPDTFFPSPGKIEQWEFPQIENIRYDFGVKNGMEVTPFYDPLIGKVIAKGHSRKEAIQTLLYCLEKANVSGIKTNLPLLIDTLKNEQFQAGNITTNFVTKELQKNR